MELNKLALPVLLPATIANVPDTNLRFCAIYTESFNRRQTDMFVLLSRKESATSVSSIQNTQPTKSTIFDIALTVQCDKLYTG